LFMSVVVALFIGLTVSAEEIIRDRKILKRESFLNLSKTSYLFSKISIMFILSAIQTATFVLVGNLVLGIKGMWVDYWLVLFTTSCFANMLGLNISSAFNSAVTIYILIPFLIIPQLLLSGVIVKFEKLNPTITSQKNVPVAGNMMASRWAFEALAVDQFIDNKFERHFYAYDEMMSYTDFRKNYWIPHLRGIIDKCETNGKSVTPKGYADAEKGILRTKEDSMANEQMVDVSLLKDEIASDLMRLVDFSTRKPAKIAPLGKQLRAQLDLLADSIAKTKYSAFGTNEANHMRDYLNLVNSVYIKIFNFNSGKRDQEVHNLERGGKTAFVDLKNDYYNEGLGDMVTNKNEFNKLLEQDGILIQRADPVFLEPYQSDIGNAHFYAPRKRFFGTYISTFWFNIGVLWSMSLLMFITLYFDLLRKIIDGLGSLGERFGKKKDQPK
ncbi:MAG TPA: ABC transporter permease, partial [Bacteroidia bacterium]|nr:ABC transporter permease [Bacteroidia bacterium]